MDQLTVNISELSAEDINTNHSTEFFSDEIKTIQKVKEQLGRIEADKLLKKIDIPTFARTISAEREQIRSLDFTKLDYLLGKQLIKIKRITGHFNYLVNSSQSELNYNPKYGSPMNLKKGHSGNSQERKLKFEAENRLQLEQLQILKVEFQKLKLTYFEALRASFLLNRLQVGQKYDNANQGSYLATERESSYITMQPSMKFEFGSRSSSRSFLIDDLQSIEDHSKKKKSEKNQFYSLSKPEDRLQRLEDKSDTDFSEFIEVREYTDFEPYRGRNKKHQANQPNSGYTDRYLKLRNLEVGSNRR